MLTIREVVRYRVEYTGRDGRRRHAQRATLDGVYDKIAWWLIDDRHDYEDDEGYWQHSDPDSPYMRRLHDRILRWLKAGYIRPESDTIAERSNQP